MAGPLAVADRRLVESWCGPIEADEETATEERVGRLGFAAVAALEILSTRYAGLLREPMRMRFDGDATWETDRNAEAMLRQIRALVSVCRRLVGLSPEAEAVVAAAEELSADEKLVRGVHYQFNHVRPG
jgi:hypothetical protein